MNEARAIDVHIIQSQESPGRMGEAGTSLIAPAVANAIKMILTVLEFPVSVRGYKLCGNVCFNPIRALTQRTLRKIRRTDPPRHSKNI
jgi:ketopantoate reductase